VLRLDIHDDRAAVRDKEVVRDVLTDLSVYLRLQQERLGQDAMHCTVEVREDQPLQFKPGLAAPNADSVRSRGR
jgi:hypothetical protein